MASRTSWEGYLKLNLLSIPVKAYNAAASGGGKIGFHLIHATCHSRIRYEKVCPEHGEVPDDEIVKAFEFAKGQYVVVDDADREKLLPEDDKAIAIDTFIRPGDLDPIYYGDRSYYLVPDGRVAQKPYAVLQRVMAERGRYAVAQMVMSGRGQVVLVRPVEGLLAMTVLNYDEEVKKPAEFADDVPDVAVAAKEMELAESLVDASTAKRFDFSDYKDEYTEKLTAMLEAKSSGKKVVRARREDEPAVLNLMDALRQSLARAKPSGAAKGGGRRPAIKKTSTRPKKAAHASKSRRTAARRKTG
jgi:DNA end-binding protein Ku